MTDTNKVATTTVSSNKEIKKYKRNGPTIRLILSLPESTDKSCPEFNYGDLLSQFLSERLGKKKLGDVINGPPLDGLDPFAGDEDEALKALAKQFERKYGGVGAKKRRRRDNNDFKTLGEGYDETDPFIDNSDAVDDVVPTNLETKHRGFYINSGELDFEEVQVSEEESVDSDSILAMKRKRIAISSEEDSLMEEDAVEEEDEMGKTRENGIVKKLKLDEGEMLRRRKKMINKFNNKGGSKKESLEDQGELNSSIEDKDGAKSIAESIEAVVNMARKSAAEKSLQMEEDLTDARKGEEGPKKKNGKQPSSCTSSSSSRSYSSSTGSSSSSESESEDDPEREGKAEDVSRVDREAEKEIQLPSNLHQDMMAAVERLKEVGKVSKGSSQKFFTESVNQMLLNVEINLCKHEVRKKTEVYKHLSQHLPCKAQTLVKRGKNLLHKFLEDRLKVPLKRLKDVVTVAMPALIESHAAECKKIADTKGSSDSNVGKESADLLKKAKLPKKKFIFTKEIRELLCEVVRERLKGLSMMKKRSETPQQHVIAFFDERVKPIWPKGWMTSKILFKESSSVHAMTGSSSLTGAQKIVSGGGTVGPVNKIELPLKPAQDTGLQIEKITKKEVSSIKPTNIPYILPNLVVGQPSKQHNIQEQALKSSNVQGQLPQQANVPSQVPKVVNTPPQFHKPQTIPDQQLNQYRATGQTVIMSNIPIESSKQSYIQGLDSKSNQSRNGASQSHIITNDGGKVNIIHKGVRPIGENAALMESPSPVIQDRNKSCLSARPHHFSPDSHSFLGFDSPLKGRHEPGAKQNLHFESGNKTAGSDDYNDLSFPIREGKPPKPSLTATALPKINVVKTSPQIKGDIQRRYPDDKQTITCISIKSVDKINETVQGKVSGVDVCSTVSAIQHPKSGNVLARDDDVRKVGMSENKFSANLPRVPSDSSHREKNDEKLEQEMDQVMNELLQISKKNQKTIEEKPSDGTTAIASVSDKYNIAQILPSRIVESSFASKMQPCRSVDLSVTLQPSRSVDLSVTLQPSRSVDLSVTSNLQPSRSESSFSSSLHPLGSVNLSVASSVQPSRSLDASVMNNLQPIRSESSVMNKIQPSPQKSAPIFSKKAHLLADPNASYVPPVGSSLQRQMLMSTSSIAKLSSSLSSSTAPLDFSKPHSELASNAKGILTVQSQSTLNTTSLVSSSFDGTIPSAVVSGGGYHSKSSEELSLQRAKSHSLPQIGSAIHSHGFLSPHGDSKGFLIDRNEPLDQLESRAIHKSDSLMESKQGSFITPHNKDQITRLNPTTVYNSSPPMMSSVVSSSSPIPISMSSLSPQGRQDCQFGSIQKSGNVVNRYGEVNLKVGSHSLFDGSSTLPTAALNRPHLEMTSFQISQSGNTAPVSHLPTQNSDFSSSRVVSSSRAIPESPPAGYRLSPSGLTQNSNQLEGIDLSRSYSGGITSQSLISSSNQSPSQISSHNIGVLYSSPYSSSGRVSLAPTLQHHHLNKSLSTPAPPSSSLVVDSTLKISPPKLNHPESYLSGSLPNTKDSLANYNVQQGFNTLKKSETIKFTSSHPTTQASYSTISPQANIRTSSQSVLAKVKNRGESYTLALGAHSGIGGMKPEQSLDILKQTKPEFWQQVNSTSFHPDVSLHPHEAYKYRTQQGMFVHPPNENSSVDPTKRSDQY